MSIWAAHELATLMEAQKTGRSAAQIMEFLPGRSRSAVVGKAWRKGITLHGKPGPRSAIPPAQKYREAIRRQLEALA